jgi:hypothetical protein
MNILNLRGYGDFEQVSEDVKTLHDILNRQSTNLVIDCLAEHIGMTARKFNLTEEENLRMLARLQAELTEQTLERI